MSVHTLHTHFAYSSWEDNKKQQQRKLSQQDGSERCLCQYVSGWDELHRPLSLSCALFLYCGWKQTRCVPGGLPQQCVVLNASTAVLIFKKKHYSCLYSFTCSHRWFMFFWYWRQCCYSPGQQLLRLTTEWLCTSGCLFGLLLLGGLLIPPSLLQLILMCCGTSCICSVLAPLMPHLFFLSVIIPDRKKIMLFKKHRHSVVGLLLPWPPLTDFLFTSYCYSSFRNLKEKTLFISVLNFRHNRQLEIIFWALLLWHLSVPLTQIHSCLHPLMLADFRKRNCKFNP